MAITINGSGTITGVSAGGLPDGCVTDDDLASTLDLSGKTMTYGLTDSDLSGVSTGKVLQTVSARFTSTGSVSIGQSDYTTSPSITKSITPVGSGSSFLIYIRWFGECDNGESTVAHVYRGSSRINEASTSVYHGLSMPTQTGNHGDIDSTPQIMYLQTLDTTGSTAGTSITYTLKYSSAVTSGTMYTNRVYSGYYGGTHYETGVSEIIITEIGA